jgi:hypothetical protein
MFQEIIVLFIFMLAIGYLFKTFFMNSKKNETACGSKGCGCKD